MPYSGRCFSVAVESRFQSTSAIVGDAHNEEGFVNAG